MVRKVSKLPRKVSSPETIVAKIAAIYDQRRALERRAEELKKEEDELLVLIHSLLWYQHLPSCTIATGHKVVLGKKPIATVTSWKDVLLDVAKHAEEDERYLHVVHQRVSPTTIEELAFEKKYVTGVVLEHKSVATFSAPRKKAEKK